VERFPSKEIDSTGFLFPENANQITGICHWDSSPPLDHISTNPSRHSITLP
jgi:hypothetical protein